MDVHDRIVDLVDNPGWKSLLVDIVQAEGMDPWNIDVTLLSGKYLDKIRAMQKLDFRIPANAVLCSAILIRFKSDSWDLFPQEKVEDDLEEDSNWEYIIEGQRVPELDPARRITRRRITIDELISAVEHVMEKEKRRAMRSRERREISPELVNIAFEDSQDFEERLEEVYEKVLATKDSENLVLFSSLLRDQTRDETIMTLLPVLHLATQEKIGIWQEEIFDEIFITVKENGTGKPESS